MLNGSNGDDLLNDLSADSFSPYEFSSNSDNCARNRFTPTFEYRGVPTCPVWSCMSPCGQTNCLLNFPGAPSGTESDGDILDESDLLTTLRRGESVETYLSDEDDHPNKTGLNGSLTGLKSSFKGQNGVEAKKKLPPLSVGDLFGTAGNPGADFTEGDKELKGMHAFDCV